VPDFDSNIEWGNKAGRAEAIEGLKIPTWITLRNLQDKFRGIAHQIVTILGKVLDAAPNNLDSKDPQFCIGLQLGAGWKQSVTITNQHT
jgi:hypothetical protein